MFGQRPTFGGTSSSFGSSFGSNPASSSFGASAFGRPAFGTPQTTAASTPFGTNTTGSSLFGSQPSGGSLFGQTTQASGFGSSSAFGTSGGGMFSSTTNPPASTSLFGTGTSSAFNTSQNQQRPFTFGNPTTSTSGGSLFGTTTTPAGGSLFGSSIGQAQGTTIKYNSVQGSDTMTRGGVSSNIQTKIEVITAMKEYETKSLEELRVEDYLAGRKGPGQGQSTGFGFPAGAGKFGATSTSTPLFGQTSTASGGMFAAKPQETKSVFGTGTAFGTPTTGGGLFSSPTPAFGQTTTSSSGFSFGSTTQSKPGGFSFGQQSSATPAFGMSNTTTQSGSAFGPFGFGNTAGQTTGAFGAAKPAFGVTGTAPSTGLFGKTTGAFGGFGTSSASPFGTTNTATGTSLFGAQNQSKPGFTLGTNTGAFGSTTGFGSGGGLFGQNPNQAKPGLSFGNTGGFGTSTSTAFGGFNQAPSAGLFGNQSGGFFGNQNTGLNTGTSSFGTNLGTGLGVNPLQPNQMNLNGAGVNNNISNLIKALTHNPFGNSSLLKSASIPTGKADELLNPTPSSSSAGDPSKAAATKKPIYVLPSGMYNSTNPKPVGLNRITTGNDPARNMLFAGLDDPTDFSTDDPAKPKFFPSVKKLGLKVFKNIKNGTESSSVQDNCHSGTASPLTTPIGSPIVTSKGLDASANPLMPLTHDDSPTLDIIKGRNNIKQLNVARKHPLNDTMAELKVVQKSSRTPPSLPDDQDPEANKENDSISLLETSVIEDHPEALHADLVPPHPAGIKLTRKGYYTLPDINQLKEMVGPDGKCLVENFTVGRYKYGNICFLGVTDISGLDVDAVVFIVRKEVEVYPEGVEKPSVGEALNKPAFVTLDCVWPVDKTSREIIKSEERLEIMGWPDYLERQCLKMDATFVEYRPETGSWVFKVKHFSKYGLEDDNEETPSADTAVAGTQPRKAAEKKGFAPHLDTPPVQTVTETSKNAQYATSICVSTPLPIASPSIFTTKGVSSGPPSIGLVSPPSRNVTHSSEDFAFVPSRKVYLDGTSEIVMEEEVTDVIAAEPEESAYVAPLSPSVERITLSSKTPHRMIQSKKSQLFYEDLDFEVTATGKGEKRTGLTVSELEKSFQNDISRVLNMDDITTHMSAKKLLIASQTMEVEPTLPREEMVVKSQLVLQPETTYRNTIMEHEDVMLRGPRSEYLLLPSSKDQDSEPDKDLLQHLDERIGQKESMISNVSKCISDASAFMGRSFRVGWGPGLTFVHGGTTLGNNIFAKRITTRGNEMDCSPVSFLFTRASSAQVHPTRVNNKERFELVIDKIHLASDTPQNISEAQAIDPLLKCCLHTVLEHHTSKVPSSKTEDAFPYFEPSEGLDLLHHLAATAAEINEAQDTGRKLSRIFNLCVALWGNLEFYCPESDGQSVYIEAQARKEALSQWLEIVSKDFVTEEVERALSQTVKDAYLDAIFSHMSARHISEACQLAQKEGDFHLSLLLSQVCLGQEAPRQILKHQLYGWLESGADAHMSLPRLVLYSLLSGEPTHKASHVEINTCLGLDWKRCLALHLWYICPATATISEALELFENAAGLGKKESEDIYCEEPRPSYLIEPIEDLKINYDICYHLMKIYVDPTHKLESLLETSTTSPDPMDLTVSWLVWCILHSLGYQLLCKGKATALHLGMAGLMESQGHWDWAAFVLLFITDELSREKELSSLLERQLLVEGEQGEDDSVYGLKESFLIDELQIPIRRLHRAKAIRARSLKMIDEETWYLMKDQDFNRAHTHIVHSIAPNAIINEDHSYLAEFLGELEVVKSQVIDWPIGGSIYWAYLQMIEQINTLKAAGDLSGKEVERLRPKLLSLCSKLNNLKCPTAIHKVAVSEMSRVVVSVLRAILGSGPDAARVLAQQITALPLTQECALEELNLITHQYLTSIAMET